MILYFDSYITDIPLNKTFVDANTDLRNSTKNYAMPRKIDIAKYTLASYALYPWSHVLIRYELDDNSEYKKFDEYIKELFPDAIIMHKRSANQSEYIKSAKIINEWDDDWIWYSSNNDHPIMSNDISNIDDLLSLAETYNNHYKYISIPYSHFSEYINLPKVGSPFWRIFGRDTCIIYDNNVATVFSKKSGDNSSVLIVNKGLFNFWFNSHDLGDSRIIRPEDIRKFFKTEDQLILAPKKEIAAHFDGYSHTNNGLVEITADQIPPLFIPAGFFENDIKIKYGFSDYDENYTNINPLSKYYSFENKKNGTDIKTSIEDIPLFWKERISEIIQNKNISISEVKKSNLKKQKIINDPYKIINKKINLKTFIYFLRTIRSKFQGLPDIP